jgi:hypothetical protein
MDFGETTLLAVCANLPDGTQSRWWPEMPERFRTCNLVVNTSYWHSKENRFASETEFESDENDETLAVWEFDSIFVKEKDVLK